MIVNKFDYLLGKKVNYKIKDAYAYFNGGEVIAITKHGHALIDKGNNQVWIHADLLEVIE